ncbi:MAG: hypothetical protein V4597_08665 [Pseudomonadota bacterium]
MKLIVKKELPDGTQPGAQIDVHTDVANVLILVDAARKATAADAKPKDPEPDKADAASRSRQYGRRDLTAQD